MIVFPNCKINLGLRILGKRADGYHDLETVFFPVPWCDILEVLPHKSARPGAIHFKLTGGILPDEETVTEPGAFTPADNLCIRAWRLLLQHFPSLPGVRVHLHKTIPAGAGLGGGSSDAAFLLRAVNKEFSLGLTADRLAQLALELGSDCPFFIHNAPASAHGRGEQIRPLPQVTLAGLHLVIVCPGVQVPTGAAFEWLDSQRGCSSHSGLEQLEQIVTLPVSEWRDRMLNDFEEPVFRLHPGLASIRDGLYSAGAQFAAMSGSGSSVFGLFTHIPPAGLQELFPEADCRTFAL